MPLKDRWKPIKRASITHSYSPCWIPVTVTMYVCIQNLVPSFCTVFVFETERGISASKVLTLHEYLQTLGFHLCWALTIPVLDFLEKTTHPKLFSFLNPVSLTLSHGWIYLIMIHFQAWPFSTQGRAALNQKVKGKLTKLKVKGIWKIQEGKQANKDGSSRVFHVLSVSFHAVWLFLSLLEFLTSLPD